MTKLLNKLVKPRGPTIYMVFPEDILYKDPSWEAGTS